VFHEELMLLYWKRNYSGLWSMMKLYLMNLKELLLMKRRWCEVSKLLLMMKLYLMSLRELLSMTKLC